MIITIKNDSGDVLYDTDKIGDKSRQKEAQIMISKTSTLEVVIEALTFASATHRHQLEKLLNDSAESLITQDNEQTVSEK